MVHGTDPPECPEESSDASVPENAVVAADTGADPPRVPPTLSIGLGVGGAPRGQSERWVHRSLAARLLGVSTTSITRRAQRGEIEFRESPNGKLYKLTGSAVRELVKARRDADDADAVVEISARIVAGTPPTALCAEYPPSAVAKVLDQLEAVYAKADALRVRKEECEKRLRIAQVRTDDAFNVASFAFIGKDTRAPEVVTEKGEDGVARVVVNALGLPVLRHFSRLDTNSHRDALSSFDLYRAAQPDAVPDRFVVEALSSIASWEAWRERWADERERARLEDFFAHQQFISQSETLEATVLSKWEGVNATKTRTEAVRQGISERRQKQMAAALKAGQPQQGAQPAASTAPEARTASGRKRKPKGSFAERFFKIATEKAADSTPPDPDLVEDDEE